VRKDDFVSNPLRVTVWNENRHEQQGDHPASRVYPHGIHGAIAEYLREQPGLEVRTATLDEPDQGLPAAVLDNTDVLTWWGHAAHQDVSDALVDRIQARVLAGMGLIVLHSAHFSKIFKRLMGTSCELQWREANDHERIWVVEPGHPIAAGLPPYIELEHEEMYGERFDIPAPETLVLLSWFSGGEVFRSGCCYTRGLGKIFYFRPGHESFPTYYDPRVRQVIGNAVRWAAPAGGTPPVFGNVKPREQS
jgi:trehalose utilization protein